MDIELGDFAADERCRVGLLSKAATDAVDIFERIESRERKIRAIKHSEVQFLSILFEHKGVRVGVGGADGLATSDAKQLACEVLEKEQIKDFLALDVLLGDVAKGGWDE